MVGAGSGRSASHSGACGERGAVSGAVDNPLVGLLLEIKDEIDAAKGERSRVVSVLERSKLTELDRAFASLRKAEDFERESRLHYRDRLQDFARWRRRTLWLASMGAALGALLGAFLLVWGLTALGASSPRLCDALGGQHGANQQGMAFCTYWGS
jgi:hypothetical protein